MAPEFLWGAATSAHQIEGNNIHNDWWQWEKEGKTADRSGAASDHYRRFRDDFTLARHLGHTAHRLSIEWSRIELAPGQFNQTAIDHYKEVLTALREAGLTSFVTLHHFTNPLWFSRQGGWEQPRASLIFARYVQKVVRELGSLVDFWITINEPNIYVLKGYWEGSWPPGKKRAWRSVERVTHAFAAAHQQAYEEIHTALPQARVGIAHNMAAFLPGRASSRADRAVVRLHDWYYNHRFFQLTSAYHDFIGVNYYFAAGRSFQWRFPFFRQTELPYPHTEPFHWSLYPEGLTKILVDLKRYQRPIYITENGMPDAEDRLRPNFIRRHIRAIERAQAHGADVRGYLHWSLLDNFEWAAGFGPRFGLVAVDYATLERTPRPSAYVYKAIIEQAQPR